MRKNTKKFVLIIIAVLALIMPLGARAQVMDNGKDVPELVNYMSQFSWPAGPDVSAEGAYLIDADTGAVLYRKNSNEQFYPASITKVLTALVVCEQVSDLGEMLTFSHNAIYNLEEGGFSYVAKEGDQLSVYDTLHAMLMNSSNESAVALAEHVAGSVEEFAKLMNEKAKSLGANDSNFVNPNGLSNTEHKTTPHDMALILRAAVNNTKFLEIDTKTSYTTAPTTAHPEGYGCIMSHKMMQQGQFYDERVVCGKTGYLSMAQNTLVTYASSGDMNLVCVVMRDNGATAAYNDTKALFNYGFNNFERKSVSGVINSDELRNKLQETSSSNVAGVEYDDTFALTLPKGVSAQNVTWAVSCADGDSTGKVTYYLDGVEVLSRNVTVTYTPSFVEDIADVMVSEEGGLGPVSIILIILAAIAALGTLGLFVFKKRRLRQMREMKSRGRSRSRGVRSAEFFNEEDF